MLIANTVPAFELPPPNAVPYRVLPDKINPAPGLAPSPGGPVKQCRFVKPVPSVLTLNTVPSSEVPPFSGVLPPEYAVPYKVLPDKTNPAVGYAPSLLVPK